ncbi:MAG: TonB-dependent receptor [Burkholderiaceae bacterium]
MNQSSLSAPLAALPLALVATLSHAQTEGSSVPVLPTTVVTATRVAQPITDVVADVTVVDRAEIERSGASGVVDVLARLPGVSIARNGGVGANASVYIRGAETRFTAVFVDGVRVDSQSTGGASWNLIPVSQIDRIEVVRGPAAAVYGSDALGGVIQIFTRRGEAGFSPSLEVGVGSQGTRKVAASLSGKHGAVDYAIGASRESSDGFNAQPEGNPDVDGYRNTAFSGSLGWQLNAKHKLQASVLDSDLEDQYDGFEPGVDDRAKAKLQTLALNWNAQWSEAYSTQLGVNRSKDHYETSPSVYLAETQITSYLFQNNWKLGATQLTASLERREDQLLNASTTPFNTERSQNALALGYALRSGAHSLQLNLRRDDDSEFGGKSTGGLAYAFGFAPHWRAVASAGTAFRAPTLFQRFSVYGVADLKPESSRNAEAGVRYEAQGHSFSAIAFRNKVSDLITYQAGPGACANGAGLYPGCYGNTSRAQYSGVTLAGATHAGSASLWGSVDFLNPKNLDTGLQLARRAKRSVKLGADVPVAGWTLGAEAELVGKRFDDAANTRELDSYNLLNLTVSKALAKDWTLLGRVDNVTDADYQTASGYATAGRTLYVGLKWAPN